MKKLLLPNLPEVLQIESPHIVVGLVSGMVITGLIASVIGIIFSMLKPTAASISSLCLLIIVHNLLIGASDWTRGSTPFIVVPTDLGYGVILSVVFIALLTARIFRDSSIGLSLRASWEGDDIIRMFGVNLFYPRYASFILSAIVMSAAGTMMAHYLGSFTPKTFYFHQTFIYLAMIIIGGISTTLGAVGGAVLTMIMIEILRRIEQGVDLFGIETPQIFGLTDIGLSLATLLILYKFRNGLFGKKELDDYFPQFFRRLFPKPTGNLKKKDHKDTQKKITVTGLSKSFAGLNALSNVEFELNKGEIIGLIGPNGSGKTTLVNVLTGILVPSSGNISVNGKEITADPLHNSVRYGIARSFQNIHLFNALNVIQNVETACVFLKYSQNQQYQHAYEILKLVGIEEYAGHSVSTLPYGIQKRVEIARDLACLPDFLFLDEPSAGLNSGESHKLMKDLEVWRNQFGFGLLIIDHDMHLIMNLCEKIIVLDQGVRIMEGTPKKVRDSRQVKEVYFGANIPEFYK